MNISPKNLIKFIVTVVGFLVVLAVAFWLGYVVETNDMVRELIQKYGLFGIFFIALLSGFNLAFPVPAISFLPVFLAVNENIWLVLVVITLGMTLGDGVGYLVGRYGKDITPDFSSKIEIKLQKIKGRFYKLPLIILFFYAGFVPAPNELIVIPMGFLGYKARHMLPILFFGNLIFNISIAWIFIANS